MSHRGFVGASLPPGTFDSFNENPPIGGFSILGARNAITS